ncbi:MAG: sugar phosphate isomerase/epimerase [Planctomycetaceae bacterium]|jgi:sugar phosphate isomerase/epimerase|nr:sugar phosphate isomerase/epimerase [Planctomycetaceae bacterium]
MKRREFLSLAAGSLLLADAATLLGANEKTPWKVGICDWDIRDTKQLDTFAVAKELGFEGVQISCHVEGPEVLANKEYRPKLLAAAKESGIAIASFAMGILNVRALATTPEAEGWVEDCIDAMVDMKIDRILLAFFHPNGDMNEHKEHQPIVIEKLKRLASIAEKNKKILAIESYLSAEDNLKLIDAIGSDAVKVYYDVRNSRDKDYDIFREMELLGSKKMICEIHFKENTCRLGDGDIDFPKVCKTLEKIDYKGWIVVESASPGDWKESQAANAKFVKKVIGR